MILCFFFNDTATSEIYTLSLHDALPISYNHRRKQGQKYMCRQTDARTPRVPRQSSGQGQSLGEASPEPGLDRKSTRLNSSHANISYAVFCLKKKKRTTLRFDFSP